MPKSTRTALGKQGAAVAQRKRTGGTQPKTRKELYEEAKRRDLPAARRWDVTSSPRPSARSSGSPIHQRLQRPRSPDARAWRQTADAHDTLAGQQERA
jgi:hypothetical protein